MGCIRSKPDEINYTCKLKKYNNPPTPCNCHLCEHYLDHMIKPISEYVSGPTDSLSMASIKIKDLARSKNWYLHTVKEIKEYYGTPFHKEFYFKKWKMSMTLDDENIEDAYDYWKHNYKKKYLKRHRHLDYVPQFLFQLMRDDNMLLYSTCGVSPDRGKVADIGYFLSVYKNEPPEYTSDDCEVIMK